MPHDITRLPPPPRSPELNPAGNVWRFLRDAWLPNRVLRGYDDILARCCEAWNEPIAQPGKIRSIGRRA